MSSEFDTTLPLYHVITIKSTRNTSLKLISSDLKDRFIKNALHTKCVVYALNVIKGQKPRQK